MRVNRTLAVLGVGLACSLGACGDGGSDQPDAPAADAPPDGDPLATLAGTGLCVDAACAQISPDVREYEPRFQLYDDGATKRRWIYLPPGTKIDTADMNHWVFPVGTKVWKEFSRGDVRVETRLILKRLADDNAPGAWFYTTYQWNAAQDSTIAVIDGVKDANGTPHDIPSRDNCRDCHERLQPSRVLGFDAIQLDAASDKLDLDELVVMQLLTAPPAGVTPRFPLPGDGQDEAVLGYLHANCGHCHNPTSDVFDMTPTDLRLRTDADQRSSVAATPAHRTMVNVNASIPYAENGMTRTTLIVPGQPNMSALIGRMESANPIRFMPNLAVETPDTAARTAIAAWITQL